MSFILDALRKSETERQRGALPGIANVPLAVPRATLPGWAIAVMVVLGASAALMAAAWWRASESQPSAAPQEAAARTAIPLPLAADAPPREPAAPAPSRASTALRAAAAAAGPAPEGPSALQRLAAEGATSRASRPASAAPPAADPPAAAPLSAAAPSAPAPAAAAPAATTLPSAADLIARGENLPSLRLELHVFGPTARDRYVFINGRMYREGETLREGPELLRIDPQGAALRHRGQDFVLTQ